MLTTKQLEARRQRLLKELHHNVQTTARQLRRTPIEDYGKEMSRPSVLPEGDRQALLEDYQAALAALGAVKRAVDRFEEHVERRRRGPEGDYVHPYDAEPEDGTGTSMRAAPNVVPFVAI